MVPISEPSTVLILEQVNKLLEDQDAKLLNHFSSIHHNANFTKPVNVEPVMPSRSMLVSSALKPMDFPYGMLMNYPKGQGGPSAGLVGTNAIVVNPTYTSPMTSVP